LAAGFCPKNLAFARKIMVLPVSGGCSPLARTPMLLPWHGIILTMLKVYLHLPGTATLCFCLLLTDFPSSAALLLVQ